MFGLAAIAAVAAMGFVGGGTASAEGIAICKKNELPCPIAGLVSLVHATLQAGTVGQLLSNLATILCLEVLAEAHIEGAVLVSPGSLNAIILATFNKCGSNVAHDNCSSIQTVGENGLVTLTKTADNLGTTSGTAAKPGSVNVQCVIFGLTVNCDYSGERLSFPIEGSGHTAGAGNGRLTANKTPVGVLGLPLTGLFCPEKSTLDAELISLSPIFITG